MAPEEEASEWEKLICAELNPKELPSQPFSSFYSVVHPNAIFRTFYEYLKTNKVTPIIDETNWKMSFEFNDDQFCEQLCEDPDFVASENAVKADPVSVEMQVRVVSDPDAELVTEECENEAETQYYVDFRCTGGSLHLFADFYRQAKTECLINCHIA
jgi:hypothetical protein